MERKDILDLVMCQDGNAIAFGIIRTFPKLSLNGFLPLGIRGIPGIDYSFHNAKDDNQKPDSSGMDIPSYAYERMAKWLLPTMRTYFESEEGKKILSEIEDAGNLRHAA